MSSRTCRCKSALKTEHGRVKSATVVILTHGQCLYSVSTLQIFNRYSHQEAIKNRTVVALLWLISMTSLMWVCMFFVRGRFRGGLRGGYSYKFLQICHLMKYCFFTKRSFFYYYCGDIFCSPWWKQHMNHDWLIDWNCTNAIYLWGLRLGVS